MRPVLACTSRECLEYFLRRAPRGVIAVCHAPAASLFPARVRAAVSARLADDVDLAVASAFGLGNVGVEASAHDLLVVRHGVLLQRYAFSKEALRRSFYDAAFRAELHEKLARRVCEKLESAPDAMPGPGVRSGTSTPPPHEVLGVSEDASLQEIKRAHRIKAKLYHSDRLRPLVDAQRLSEEFIAFADERLAQINSAARAMFERRGRGG